MASVSNIFHGHIEMDMTHNLLLFLKHAGVETFIHFLADENDNPSFDKQFFLNTIETQDSDDIVFTVEQSTEAKDGRMDGVIRHECDTEADRFIIVIESKRDEQAREWQLKKYSDDLESKSIDKNKCLLVSLSGWIDKGIEPTKGVIYKTWKELVKHLEKQSKPTQCSQNENIQKHFLIEQFKQYLEERGYGMYKPIIIKEFMEYPTAGPHIHDNIIKSLLGNYQKLSDQLAIKVEDSYFSKYKSHFNHLQKDPQNHKTFLWSHSILMHLWYTYKLEDLEGITLQVKLEIKNYECSFIALWFNRVTEKNATGIMEWVKKQHQGQSASASSTWKQVNYNSWCVCSYHRSLLKEEVDAVLQEDFDSEPFKKMLEDYCMLLHFAEQFASENT